LLITHRGLSNQRQAEEATVGNSDSKQRHWQQHRQPAAGTKQQTATAAGDDGAGAAKTALASAPTGTILLDVTKTLFKF
jgi:hypothetical protein